MRLRTIDGPTSVFLFTIILAAAAAAEPVHWPGNDHYYEAISVPGGISWTEARDLALIAGGYLATVTSSAENDFVYGLIDAPDYWNQEPEGSNLGPWIGGYQTFDDGGQPDANWAWITGETWDYTDWHSGEPNNFFGVDEDYLHYKCWGSAGCRSRHWNDLPNEISLLGTAVIAYVVEYDHHAAARSPSATGAALRATPNPFNPVTELSYRLDVDGPVLLTVHDLAGRLVATLFSGAVTAGDHAVVWRGRDDRGRSVPSGTYFAVLRGEFGREIRTLTLLQ